jgi:hypothetical protein
VSPVCFLGIRCRVVEFLMIPLLTLSARNHHSSRSSVNVVSRVLLSALLTTSFHPCLNGCRLHQ